MKCKIIDENATIKYGLILPNHECGTYYRWTDLKRAKQDAQKVADGWHEYIEVAEISRDTIKIVFVAKPKSEIAKVPQYNYDGNRIWEMEWKTDAPR